MGACAADGGSQMERANRNPYVGYEYKEIAVPEDQASLYMDCYENFGWQMDGMLPSINRLNLVTLHLKRDRRIINKMELTRLQRNFEACAREIDKLERAKTSAATAWSIAVGVVGTAFMAGSVFAVSHEPPMPWLCALLALPAFAGWILPYFVYRAIVARRTVELQPIIEAKRDEIYEICKKGHDLL